MANEWKTVRLSEIYEIRSGLSKPRSEFGFGHGFLTFKDVLDNYFVPNTLIALVNSTEQERNLCSVRRGDVFLTRTSETQEDLGMSCVALKDYEGATFNGFTKRLRPKPCAPNVIPEYAAYYFRGPRFRRAVTAMSSLSTRASLNNEMLERLTIVLPPVDVQAAIGKVLKTLDDKIELNRRMNETLEAMVRAIFKSWFVDFSPVRAKAEGHNTGLSKSIANLFPNSFKDSELGRIPEGWRIVTLDTQVEAQKGLSYKGSGLAETGIPMHNLNSVYEGGGYKFEGIKFYAGEYEKRHIIQPGNLIVTNTEQGHDCLLIGYAAVVPKCFGSSGLFTHHLYRVRPLKDAYLTSQYLAFLFNSRTMHEEISGYGNGTTVNMLPADALQRPKIVMPPAPLVHAFDRLAVASFGRCEETVTQNQTLTQIRDALLPRLLSGELSVSQAAKPMKEAL